MNQRGFATFAVVLTVVALAIWGAAILTYKKPKKEVTQTPKPSEFSVFPKAETLPIQTKEKTQEQPKKEPVPTASEKKPATPITPATSAPTPKPSVPTPATPVPAPAPASLATFALKSDFFKNGATAQKIAAAQTPSYQLTNFASKSSFSFKLISGLVQLGYIFQKIDYSTPHTRMLQNFQRDYNLIVSNAVDQNVLQQLDTLLAEREVSEVQTAKTFPLYNNMASLPAGYPTKDHALFVYVSVFKSLPSQLATWTFDNFKNFYDRHQIADPITYYFDYCSSLDCFSRDDFTLAANVLHEYAHYLEASGQVQTASLYEIGWTLDPYSPYSSTRATPKGAVKRSQPANPATYPNQQGFLYHDDSLSQYAGALLSGGVEEGKINSIAEEFAELFAAYVLEGRVFRGKAANNAVLLQKYNWLKNNVFSGKEYQTGNANYINLDFQPQDNDHGFKVIPAKIEDYSIMDISVTKWVPN